MSFWLAFFVALPPLLLIGASLACGAFADRQVIMMRRAASLLLSAACVSAVMSALLLMTHGPLDVAIVAWSWPIPLNLGVYFDGLAAGMSLLITFIGLTIVRYSARYLDGEARQGRFLRWIVFTIGTVLLMVVSRNLVMFTLAWMLTSLGLHQLLTHYPDRPWAVWAARKKFLISRLGDVMLIAALALTYHCFGSFDYREIFANAESLRQSSSANSALLSLIGVLFVIGAMTKSAQFPFHSWLPDTMETPTPVSALMHAGVINAGGFLVIRLSPLVSQSHVALELLVVFGAFTALMGSVIALTQTSIKRALAYSTIAQMGFMMLQCGLGAYSAALLHLFAHSLYKAHAFLSSGSVLESAARTRAASGKAWSGRALWLAVPAAVGIAFALQAASVWMWGIDLNSKPGALVLGLVLTLALTQLLWQSLAAGSSRIAAAGIAAAGAVSCLYFGGWLAIHHLLASSPTPHVSSLSLFDALVMGVVSLGFIGVFLLQAVADQLSRRPVVRALYVHAANGFYLDIPARRLTAVVWGGNAPTP